MANIAKQEACQLYIEQEINEGIAAGKTPYSVAKEIIPWLQKLFDVDVKPKTIEKRAERIKNKLTTNVGNGITSYKNNKLDNLEKLEKKPVYEHGGARVGSGRPAIQQEQPVMFVCGEKEILEKAKEIKGYHRAIGTGENEWYTPIEYIEAVKNVLGKINTDPASSRLAQEAIKAKIFYTVEDDGLQKEWNGTVWLNPPYSQPAIKNFIEKLINEYVAGRTTEAILLTHNYTDTAWFHLAAGICSAICFTRGRIAFINPEGKKAAPTQGQAFFYYGDNQEKFKEIFSKFGLILYG